MPNTLDTALTTAHRAQRAITYLQNKLAALAAFTVQVETDPLKPKATVQVEVVTTGGNAQTNTTNFEDTTNFVATTVAVPVTVDRITVGGHITAAERDGGHTNARILDAKLDEFASAVMAVVLAPVTVGNFGAAGYTGPAAGFGQDELSQIWEHIAKATVKTAVLDKDFYRMFLPRDLQSFDPATIGLPGWTSFLLNTASWDSAGLDVAGFGCAPEAIAVATGLPLNSARAGRVAAIETITIPGLNIQAEYSEWYATAGKVDWFNLEVMIGAAPAVASALKIIKRS